MKSIAMVLLSTLTLSFGVMAQSAPVKMSKSGICHKPGSTYYNQTKNFTPYPTLKDCLSAGGRMPKQ
jgi:hypothetical protein